jgi:heme exporter protein D
MNWEAFFAMGGHGSYIWGAYGIAAVVLALNVIQPLRDRRALLKRLRGYYRIRNQSR